MGRKTCKGETFAEGELLLLKILPEQEAGVLSSWFAVAA